MLGIYEFTDFHCNHSFLMETQDPMIGGFAKWPGTTPGKDKIRYIFIYTHIVFRMLITMENECILVCKDYYHHMKTMIVSLSNRHLFMRESAHTDFFHLFLGHWIGMWHECIATRCTVFFVANPYLLPIWTTLMDYIFCFHTFSVVSPQSSTRFSNNGMLCDIIGTVFIIYTTINVSMITRWIYMLIWWNFDWCLRII